MFTFEVKRRTCGGPTDRGSRARSTWLPRGSLGQQEGRDRRPGAEEGRVRRGGRKGVPGGEATAAAPRGWDLVEAAPQHTPLEPHHTTQRCSWNTTNDMDPAPKPRRFRGRLNAGTTEQNAVVKASGHGQAAAGGTRGEDLQELELEMHKGTSLPMHYNFELAKTAKRIRTLQATTVALQMPEGLLMFACSVGDALKKACDTLERCVVMSDAAYGACCVDDRGAEAMGAQLLVHYGHSCLVPVDETRIPCMYVFVDIKFNVDHLVECVEQNFAVNKKLLVAGTIQFASSLQEAKLRWQRNGRPVEVPQSKPLSPGEVLGCTAPSMADDKELDAIVFVADGRFHLEAIMIANPTLPTYRYDPYAKVMTREYYDHTGMKDQRREAVEEAREAKVFGVILGTLGRQGNPKVLEQIGNLLDSKGVGYVLFLADEISPEMIGTLVEEGCVDAFIQIACPRLSIDWGEGFQVPVLTPFEAFVAFGAAPAWWESSACCSNTCNKEGCSKNEARVQPYPMDYYAKDGGPWSSSYHRERKRTQVRERTQGQVALHKS